MPERQPRSANADPPKDTRPKWVKMAEHWARQLDGDEGMERLNAMTDLEREAIALDLQCAMVLGLGALYARVYEGVRLLDELGAMLDEEINGPEEQAPEQAPPQGTGRRAPPVDRRGGKPVEGEVVGNPPATQGEGFAHPEQE